MQWEANSPVRDARSHDHSRKERSSSEAREHEKTATNIYRYLKRRARNHASKGQSSILYFVTKRFIWSLVDKN